MKDDAGAPLSLSVESISPNPLNPRMFFREEEMDALKDSIARLGILVPLVVFKDIAKPKNYVLLDGERRLRCARDLGLPTVPVNITVAPNAAQNILRMFNIHSLREQWDPYTIAKALDLLMKELKTRNSRELATLTGFTVGSINRSKKLLRLPLKYLNVLKSELGKPKSEQVLTEDFFLEAGDAVSAIRRNQSELYDQYGQTDLLDRLVERRTHGSLRSITDLRVVADLANYEKSKITKRESAKRLRQIIEDPNADLRAIYVETLHVGSQVKTIGASATRFLRDLEEVDADALTETAAAELIEKLTLVRDSVTTLINRLSES